METGNVEPTEDQRGLTAGDRFSARETKPYASDGQQRKKKHSFVSPTGQFTWTFVGKQHPVSGNSVYTILKSHRPYANRSLNKISDHIKCIQSYGNIKTIDVLYPVTFAAISIQLPYSSPTQGEEF